MHIEPNSKDILVKVNDLVVKECSRIILKAVNLTISRNQIVTLVGPNGAGKSTLVKSILGLTNITSGSIVLEPKINIGYMPQKLAIETLMPLSVDRFLKLANSRFLNKQLDEICDKLKIRGLLEQALQNISGGELQRVLLARALLNKPDLLVLDEPAQGVDINGRAELYRLIKAIRDSYQCGILMVSHDLHIVMEGTDEVVCLNKHVCCSGHPKIVTQDPKFVNLFGMHESSGVTVYTHHHNHQHDLGGKIIDD